MYRVLHTCGYLTVLFANELGDPTEQGFVLRNARLSKSTENPDLLLLPFFKLSLAHLKIKTLKESTKLGRHKGAS